MVLVADTTWTPDMQVLDMGADAMATLRNITVVLHVYWEQISRDSRIAEQVNDHNRIGCHVSPYDCKVIRND